MFFLAIVVMALDICDLWVKMFPKVSTIRVVMLLLIAVMGTAIANFLLMINKTIG